MSTLDRLIDVLAAQYRWGLHPLKVFIALVMPALIVWLADRWLRARSDAIEHGEEQGRRLLDARRR